MSNKKPTIVDDAILEAKQIMEAARKLAVDDLLNELEPDINKLVNESVAENIEDEDTEDTTVDSEVSVSDETPADSEEVSVDDVAGDDSEESPIASALDDINTDETPAGDEPETGSAEDLMSGVATDDVSTDVTGDDETTVDLTGAPIDDVVKVFKEITPEDQIEVVKDENGISLDVKGEKFFIKLNENEEGQEDELIYELELSEDDENETEEQLDEVSRTHSDGNRLVKKPVGFYNYASSRLRSGLQESTEAKKTVKVEPKAEVINEAIAKELKVARAEKVQLAESERILKETLSDLGENLRSMALYNNNLGHAVKLFMEHSTTKAEKQEIIKRFNSVNTIESSKELFESISSELKNKKPITESIAEQLDSTLLGALSDKALVTENKDEVLTRMQYLMGYQNKEK